VSLSTRILCWYPAIIIDWNARGGIVGQQEILNIIRHEKPYLKKHFGLLTIGLFGSYAKGDENIESDIDFLVELAEPRFDSLAGLQLYLEYKLGQPIDLIRKRKGMNEHFLKHIEKDIHYV
jgi:predicted nucleotidyltransferase